MSFEPIAIVGQGCVLPGAHDPAAFWTGIENGRVSLSEVTPDEWGLPQNWPDLGVVEWLPKGFRPVSGLVRGFEQAFDPSGFAIDAESVADWDPALQWILHAGRQALREAHWDGPPARAGLVMGNLGFAWRGLTAYAEQVWLDRLGLGGPDDRSASAPAGRRRPHPSDRFCSGLPMVRAAQALGLEAGAFGLEAACASSLYAIKTACDRLHDGSADLMLAGAVSGAAGPQIHVGFASLGALSLSGRPLPFDRHADGMIPGEGAGLVALMRHRDAVLAGRTVLGVIRGIGLSNDGNTGGFLSPSPRGQEEAMRAAYAAAGLDPSTVTLLECHATGTAVGDAIEVRSSGAVFEDATDLVIGSAKANVGHLLATAGIAGLLKILGAFRSGLRPGTPGIDSPIESLRETPFRLLRHAEPWNCRQRAALSAFGFGGNNAHLVIDPPDAIATPHGQRSRPRQTTPEQPPQIAVVALGVRAGSGSGVADFRTALFTGQAPEMDRQDVETDLTGLRFPPNDLKEALPQQLLVLAAAREAVAGLRLPRRTSVLIGTGCDPEGARLTARWRLDAWSAHHGRPTGLDEPIGPRLSGARLTGMMANGTANRISIQFDLLGPAHAVLAEEESGLVALDLATRSLRCGEVDAAVVGAVDLSSEPVHAAAVDALGGPDRPADAAVVLVLKRLDDARRDDDPVLALLPESAGESADLVLGEGAAFDPATLFGHSHAARGLLAVAAGALALHHQQVPTGSRPTLTALRSAEIATVRCDGGLRRTRLQGADVQGLIPALAQLTVFSGSDRAAALSALEAGRSGDGGPARLAVVADSADAAARRAPAIRESLHSGALLPRGVAYRDTPLDGQIAFVYTNGSAAYPGMGSELLRVFPELIDAVRRRLGPLEPLVGWAYGRGGRPGDAMDQISGAAFLSVLHTLITREVLGIQPAAAIGYSSGEAAALAALGAWQDSTGLYAAARASGLFTAELGGAMNTVRAAWADAGVHGTQWTAYQIDADADQVRTALADLPAVHLMAVNAPGRCVIGGEKDACASALARLGGANALLLDYDVAAHVPEAAAVRDRLYELHLLPTQSVPGVRFYSGATGRPYDVTAERAAQATADQCVGTIDFTASIEHAYHNGVRIFVEHGPGSLCTGWIRRILGTRPHLAVALDPLRDGGLDGLLGSLAELAATGVPATWPERARRAEESGPVLRVPAHLSTPRRADPVALATPSEHMAAAPDSVPAVVLSRTSLPQVASPSPAAPPPAPVPARFVQALLAEQLAQVSSVHLGHVATSQEAQLRFLAQQARIAAALPRASRAPGPSGLRRRIVPSPAPVALPTASHERPGPKFSRQDLEYLAQGNVSRLFGPMFAVQDHDERQTRMPRPPLLLADRVTGIDAVPGSLATGTIWTETDLTPGAWYLDHTGRMPPGLVIEAGQADLLLISWLGADLDNRARRVYRLLGAEAVYHAPPPPTGASLDYEIRITDHVINDSQRLFTFEFDCRVDGRPMLTVRNGQAGYFTDEELADTGGVLWDPQTAPAGPGQVDKPPIRGTRQRFSEREVEAFSQGHPAACFGEQWRAAEAHVRTPRIPPGRMRLLDEVVCFDSAAGPWQRGYLQARTALRPDDWFFDGHFHNDPCMPGTLMLDGCLQAMSFYLAAAGCTLTRDAWRFEPVPEQSYRIECRGQVTPQSKELLYEVFVREFSAGPHPTVTADVLLTADGVKAVYVAGLAVRLVPDWPPKSEPVTDVRPAAQIDGIRLDHNALLAHAQGPQTQALGRIGEGFDGTRRAPRLPSPPYHFVTRIRDVSGAYGGLETGSVVHAEYDVPADAWYFIQNPDGVMPVSVLLETALQPCGWLSSYGGVMLRSDNEMLFRNLDGNLALHTTVTSADRRITTRAELTEISELNGMIIQSFAVTARVDDRPLLDGTAVFGSFTPAALANQVGFPATETDRRRLAEPYDTPVRLTPGGGLPGPMLLMLDEIARHRTVRDHELGHITALKRVQPGEWFFKAHFFQDPVMPGSIGIEAIVQALQWYLGSPGYELVSPLSWKFRGQVLPTDKEVTVEARILERPDERTVFAECWLWVDGRRIYHIPRLGLRARA
ncbi:beta-ketoacyl synthase N-terminal-like domain-containing protein [Streptomyces sp. NPDC056161]|uniref:beta-ketoacyl synthase N-terminal-like domain-containing protein n=1 Tax=Streptomyces sp. NPDC056161 TaxID=3345732 RepID=UPI0035E275F9